MRKSNKTTPFPGSPEAVELGCICPILDNCIGKGYMGQKGIYVHTAGCPVHDPKEPTNATVDNRNRRLDLSCSICPPNRGENHKRNAKHGRTKPKYKDKRK